MAVQLATVTGTFPADAAAFPTFTPSQPVNLGGGPELLGAQPVKAVISGGALKAADGTSPLQLPETNQGTPLGPTGFWYWIASGLPGIPSFGFTLTADSDITDLIGSPFSGASAVASVFGRTGAVVAAAGDYTAAEVGAVDKAGDTMGGRLAPKVVALTDAATITIDASAGNDWRVTIAGNRTMAAPSNPADGQQVTLTVTQDATGGRTLTWDAVFKFGTAGQPPLSAAAGASTMIGFRYYAVPGEWRCAGSAGGF